MEGCRLRLAEVHQLRLEGEPNVISNCVASVSNLGLEYPKYRQVLRLYN